MILLSKLAIHYYRPDFSEGQARQLISDMVQDLIEFPVPEIDMAITLYRRDPANKYFPTPAALRAIVLLGRKERAALDRMGQKVTPVNRPLMWWHRPKSRWNVGWLEADVPRGELVRDTEDGPLRAARG